MPERPKTYSPEDAPAELLGLVASLMPLLLAGDHPTCAILREQYARAIIDRVELTGVGVFVAFKVPPDVERTAPANFAGGNVNVQIEGVRNGAGCILFVRDGILSMLEGYTYSDEEWPERPIVVELRDALPLAPPP